MTGLGRRTMLGFMLATLTSPCRLAQRWCKKIDATRLEAHSDPGLDAWAQKATRKLKSLLAHPKYWRYVGQSPGDVTVTVGPEVGPHSRSRGNRWVRVTIRSPEGDSLHSGYMITPKDRCAGEKTLDMKFQSLMSSLTAMETLLRRQTHVDDVVEM